MSQGSMMAALAWSAWTAWQRPKVMYVVLHADIQDDVHNVAVLGVFSGRDLAQARASLKPGCTIFEVPLDAPVYETVDDRWLAESGTLAPVRDVDGAELDLT